MSVFITRLIGSSAQFAAVSLLALVGTWGVAFAGPYGPGRGGPGRAARMLQFFERLDLTPEQREQARATVRTAMEAGLRDLVREHARRRRELELLIRDPDVEGSRIIEAARQISASAEQLALRRHEVATSLFRILNEEQKRKARELLAERNRHLRERLDEQPESFGVE